MCFNISYNQVYPCLDLRSRIKKCSTIYYGTTSIRIHQCNNIFPDILILLSRSRNTSKIYQNTICLREIPNIWTRREIEKKLYCVPTTSTTLKCVSHLRYVFIEIKTKKCLQKKIKIKTNIIVKVSFHSESKINLTVYLKRGIRRVVQT